MNIHNCHLSLRIIKCEMLSRALENSSSLLNSLSATCQNVSTHPTIFLLVFWGFFFALHFTNQTSHKFSLHISMRNMRTKIGITRTCRNLMENEQQQQQKNNSKFSQGPLQAFVMKARSSPDDIQILKRHKVIAYAPKHIQNYLVSTFSLVRFVLTPRCYVMHVKAERRAF